MVSMTSSQAAYHRWRFPTAVALAAFAVTSHASAWQPVRKKLIHAGYPSEVSHIRRHIGKMNSLPFDASWTAHRKMDGSWNAQWQSRAAVGEDRWICEIAIPWKDIGTRPEPGTSRRANVTRHRIPHEEETTTWTPMYKTFSDQDYMGTRVFEAERR